MSKETEDRLEITLEIKEVEPSDKNDTCLLCHDKLGKNSDFCYTLVVVEPTLQTMKFDGPCFNQVLATGFKLFQELTKNGLDQTLTKGYN